MTTLNQPFALGRYQFRLQSECISLLDSLEQMLPKPLWSSNPVDHFSADEVIDLDSVITAPSGEKLYLKSLSPAHSIAYLIDRALKFHRDFLWLEGAAFVDRGGNSVLISGASFSGKTTLSLALCAAYGWKIISEDLVLLDNKTGHVLPFARPLGLRPDSLARIVKTLPSTKLAGHYADDWYFDRSTYCHKDFPVNFSTVILLSPANAEPKMPLSVKQLSAPEYLRKILPISNFSRMPDAINLTYKILETAACFDVHGGDLKERLEFLAAKNI